MDARGPGTLISASRRTDIPHYYGEWFGARRRAGWAEFRTTFGTTGRVSLRQEDVLGFLFWTKYAAPFSASLHALSEEGTPYAFQYTVNGYGASLEPHIPGLTAVIEDVLAVRRDLPGSACIEWRYDPIVLSGEYDHAYHLRRFTEIASALQGAARVVNVSVVEPYFKTARRLIPAAPDAQFREVPEARRERLLSRHPGLREAGLDIRALLSELSAVATHNGFELRSCANPEWGLPASQCTSVEQFAPYGTATRSSVETLAERPSRPGCRCLSVVDIGMDNTCVGGCVYCYVVSNQDLAVRNRRVHDPQGPRLR